jgi:hypothetical protein
MAIGVYRASTRQLTKAGFVLTRNRRRQHLLWGALCGLVCALLAILLFYFFAPEAESVRQLAQARHELAVMSRKNDERELELRMTGARTGELERQIDLLNQRIRELQDELAFYRKAQENKK